MSGQRRERVLGYLVFVFLAAVTAAGVAFVGRVVAFPRGGEAAVRAWTWGCGVSFAASAVAGALVAGGARAGMQGVTIALGSMLLRLVVLVFLGVALGVVLTLETRPFLLALGVSYLALLIVDTAYALRASPSL